MLTRNELADELSWRMKEEYSEFIKGIYERGIEYSIDHAWEISEMRGVLLLFTDEEIFFNRDVYIILLSLDKPLEYVFSEWIGFDKGYDNRLKRCVRKIINDEVNYLYHKGEEDSE
ncbi:MAG: DUF3848 domain-containing protein [Eubacterium sp.]|nr:DUF3848 domain-containing protein [Eubacterium sp.]